MHVVRLPSGGYVDLERAYWFEEMPKSHRYGVGGECKYRALGLHVMGNDGSDGGIVFCDADADAIAAELERIANG